MLDNLQDENNCKTVILRDINMAKKILLGGGSCLNVFHLNIRSINNNFNELYVLLASFDLSFNLIILTKI